MYDILYAVILYKNIILLFVNSLSFDNRWEKGKPHKSFSVFIFYLKYEADLTYTYVPI